MSDKKTPSPLPAWAQPAGTKSPATPAQPATPAPAAARKPAAPAAPAAKPAEATATKPVAKKPLTARHVTCKADETLVKGKCEAKKPG